MANSPGLELVVGHSVGYWTSFLDPFKKQLHQNPKNNERTDNKTV